MAWGQGRLPAASFPQPAQYGNGLRRTSAHSRNGSRNSRPWAWRRAAGRCSRWTSTTGGSITSSVIPITKAASGTRSPFSSWTFTSTPISSTSPRAGKRTLTFLSRILTGPRRKRSRSASGSRSFESNSANNCSIHGTRHHPETAVLHCGGHHCHPESYSSWSHPRDGDAERAGPPKRRAHRARVLPRLGVHRAPLGRQVPPPSALGFDVV